MDIIITGDLNFPSTITTWDKGDVGCTPIPKSGSTEQKKAFHLLNEIVEEHHLTQMVDKITHNKETLDLLYTSNLQVLSECLISEIYAESDHHLVSFTLSHIENHLKKT